MRSSGIWVTYTSTSEHGKSAYWVLRDRVNYYKTLQLVDVYPCCKGGAGSSRDSSAWYWWSRWWGLIRYTVPFFSLRLHFRHRPLGLQASPSHLADRTKTLTRVVWRVLVKALSCEKKISQKLYNISCFFVLVNNSYGRRLCEHWLLRRHGAHVITRCFRIHFFHGPLRMI